MNLSIPRGIVYHQVFFDILSLFKSFYRRLDRDDFIQSFQVEFAKYIGRKYSVMFPYARTAIYYALKSKKLPKGSEILMPPITIKAILDVVLSLQLKPVFIDIDPDTLCFDMKQLEKNINNNTRSVIVTYLFGMVPKMDVMINLFKKNDIFIIEDFSQCLNGEYKNKKIGTFGDVGVYSSSSIKTLDTYGGGLLVCDDKDLYKSLSVYQSKLHQPSRLNLIKKIITDLIRNIATSRMFFHFITFPVIKFMLVIRPGSMLKHIGSRKRKMIKSLPENWFEKYTSFQAELGLKLLSTIQNTDQVRIKNVEYLKSSMHSVVYPNGVDDTNNVYWQLVVFFKNPIDTQKLMHKMGVDTSTTSLEKISSLGGYPYYGETPNADYLHSNGLFIPSFPGLSMEDLHRISHVANHSVSK